MLKLPSNWNGILLVADYGTRRDRNIAEYENTHAVLEDLYKISDICTASEYARTGRYVLYPHGARPNSTAAGAARAKFLKTLNDLNPKAVVVMKTPGASSGEDEAHTKGTQAWLALRAPDSIDHMFCTLWTSHGQKCGPIIAAPGWYRRQFELERWLLRECFRRALSGALPPVPHQIRYDASPKTLKVLSEFEGPVSIDLENIPQTETLTAINLSDGNCTVSIPWDAYTSNDGTVEPGAGAEFQDGLRKFLAGVETGIYWNFTHDMALLRRHGLHAPAPIDGMAMSRALTPELPHGLQSACARWITCNPWKSEFRPKGVPPGKTKEDAAFWRCNPMDLRVYGAMDAYYTYWVTKRLNRLLDKPFKI